MIVVTGATGQLGRGVIAGLLSCIPPDRIVESVRDPAKAASIVAAGVHVRAGDFTSPGDLAVAFSGATQVLVTSVDKLGEAARDMHRAAIEAATTAGARRVLYTIHMGARSNSPFAPASDHAATEAMLAESGVNFTSIRHGFYAESCLPMIGLGIEAGEIRTPEDGPVSRTRPCRSGGGGCDPVSQRGPTGRHLTASDRLRSRDHGGPRRDRVGGDRAGDQTRGPLRRSVGRRKGCRKVRPGRWRSYFWVPFEQPGEAILRRPTPHCEALLGRRPTTMRDVLADHPGS